MAVESLTDNIFSEKTDVVYTNFNTVVDIAARINYSTVCTSMVLVHTFVMVLGKRVLFTLHLIHT